MAHARFDPLAPVAQQLAAARHTLIDRLLAGAALMALALLPLLLWRAVEVGWHLQLHVQAGVLLLTIALGLTRRRLPLGPKVGLMLAVTATVGVSGVLSLGMAGTGTFWLLMTAAFIAVFVSLAAGMAALAAAALVLAAAAWGFVGGRLAPPIDLHAHMASASGWTYFVVVLTIVPMVVLYAVGGLQRHLLQLLDTLQAQREQLERQRAALERLASHDQLTGLPQTGLAQDRLLMAMRSAERHPGKVGYLFIDLDGFKAVNDGHGHDAGDAVLREVAARLQSAVRAEDTVARIGGDEFAVVAVHLADADDALQVAAQVVQALAAPLFLGDLRLDVGASVGVALYPDHAADADALRRRADAAMYRAKQAGGCRAVLADAAPPAGPAGAPATAQTRAM